MNVEEIGWHICLFVKEKNMDSFNIISDYYIDKVINHINWNYRYKYNIPYDDIQEIAFETIVGIWKSKNVRGIFENKMKDKDIRKLNSEDLRGIEKHFKNIVLNQAYYKVIGYLRKRNEFIADEGNITDDEFTNNEYIFGIDPTPFPIIRTILKILALLKNGEKKEKEIFFLRLIIGIKYEYLEEILDKTAANLRKIWNIFAAPRLNDLENKIKKELTKKEFKEEGIER